MKTLNITRSGVDDEIKIIEDAMLRIKEKQESFCDQQIHLDPVGDGIYLAMEEPYTGKWLIRVWDWKPFWDRFFSGGSRGFNRQLAKGMVVILSEFIDRADAIWRSDEDNDESWDQFWRDLTGSLAEQFPGGTKNDYGDNQERS